MNGFLTIHILVRIHSLKLLSRDVLKTIVELQGLMFLQGILVAHVPIPTCLLDLVTRTLGLYSLNIGGKHGHIRWQDKDLGVVHSLHQGIAD